MKAEESILEPQFLLYKAESGHSRVLVRLEDETVWLSQAQMVDLFQTTKQNISLHIQNIFDEGELLQEATVKDYLTVRQEGERQVHRNITHYNLDVIISVGYRVRSHVGTQFRIWATQRLRDYLVKGFALDAQKLKEQTTLADYFDELLEQIRDIRSSERLLYKRIREICALSVDYDPQLEPQTHFFAAVQNKFHFAVTGMTAAEIVKTRADASKPNMGATSWSGNVVRKKDVTVAKNYLEKEEIETLNLVVAQFLDFAEVQTRRRVEIRMAEWLKRLDVILEVNGLQVLKDKGRISARISEEFAHEQYEIFEGRRRTEKIVELDQAPDVIELENEITALQRNRSKP